MIDDYFTILRCSPDSRLKGKVRVRLNPDCTVYAGHFPSEPVSPGVCNIEMVRQCAELIHNHTLRINSIKQCRLTTLMTPLLHPQADVNIDMQAKEEGSYRLVAAIGEGESMYLTLKADVSDV